MSRRPRFEFTSRAVPGNPFTVVEFTGQEGLSQLYQFDLTLESARAGLDPRELLNHPARLVINREEGVPRSFHGVLCAFELVQAVDGKECYRARLVPRLWWLGLTRGQQVFLDQDVPSFLAAVLLEGGLSRMDFEFRLKRTCRPEPFVCQYQETHLEFLARWLEREGICFFFEQQADFEKVVFTDDRTAHAELARPQGQPLVYAPVSGLEGERETVQSFTCQSQVLPGSVRLKDHSDQRPSLDLEGRAEVDAGGRGEVYLYGEHFRDSAEGVRLAALRREEVLCRRDLYRGAGTAPWVVPGFQARLSGHFRPAFNRAYLVLEVRHQGSQRGLLNRERRQDAGDPPLEPSYRSEFLAIPGDVQFRPPRLTPKPRINGTLPAWIDAAGDGSHAELDDQGRYKVILPFDLSGRKQGKASTYLRMAQPYAGPDEGMHFPLRKGAEVLLTFIDGDPDRPIIAGALPNLAARSPVAGPNQTSNRLLSPSGNEIQLQDQEGAESILLRVPAMNSFIQVGAREPADPAEPVAEPLPSHMGVHIQTDRQLWIASGHTGADGQPCGTVIAHGLVDAARFQSADNSLASLADPDLQNWQAEAAREPGVHWSASAGATYSLQLGTYYRMVKGAGYTFRTSKAHLQDTEDDLEMGGLDGLVSGYLEYGTSPTPLPGTWTAIKDNQLAAMNSGNTNVTKEYGNIYRLTRGQLVKVFQGNQQLIRLGGRTVVQNFNSEGFKVFESDSARMKSTTRNWSDTSKLLEGYAFRDASNDFLFSAKFPHTPGVEIHTTEALVPQTSIRVSTTTNVKVDLAAGFQFTVKGGLGMEMEICNKPSKLSFNNSSGKFRWEGPGTQVSAEAALQARINTFLIASCQTALEKRATSIQSAELAIKQGLLNLDLSSLVFLG